MHLEYLFVIANKLLAQRCTKGAKALFTARIVA
jgi:hypothetical protein